MDYPQIVTTIMEGLAPISSVVDAPWVTVTSINGMTGDVVVEPVIKPFQSNHYYLKDSIITYNGSICFAKETFTSGESFDLSDWDMPDFTQEQADWNENDSTAKSYIKNKPTIPTVNNGTLTIQRNGTDITTFSANTASNTTANISVPTKTSQITNDSDFITSNDLPTVNNATLTIQKNTTTIDTFTANSATNKTVNITVPTDTGDLTNNAGFVTANEIYPVNSVRILADTANHSTDFGMTWVRYGTGRVLVGYDSSQTEFNTIGKTGGEKTHKLTVNEMPSHKHSLPYRTGGGGGSTWYTDPGTADGYSDSKSQAQGGDQAHNNLQPYIVVSFWRRTA